MRDRNEVRLEGNLGQPAEVSEEGKGRAVLSLATNYYKRAEEGGEPSKLTTWHRLKAFGKTAEAMRGLPQGARLSVDGYINNDKYTDADGIDRFTSEVVVTDFRVIERPVRQSADEASSQAAEA
jgi:single-strand DNA-binding protein